MCVLGIDPGVAAMGYGVVEEGEAGLKAVAYGDLTTSKKATPGERLKSLYSGLNGLIEQHQPSEVAVEFFMGRNLRTALAVGQACGIVLLAAANKNLPIYEYTPLRVKQQVASYGRANKRQVQEMVKIQLGLPSIPQPDDAADALAVAICHIYESRSKKILEGCQL
jgi:crossover junction endodeoxyribonuclease RuvC